MNRRVSLRQYGLALGAAVVAVLLLAALIMAGSAQSAGAWHATDAGSLVVYNFNGNGFVDIEDIMTVTKHLEEPCP